MMTLVIAALSGYQAFRSQNLLCWPGWESSVELPFDVPCKEGSLPVAPRGSPARAAGAQKGTGLVLPHQWEVLMLSEGCWCAWKVWWSMGVR